MAQNVTIAGASYSDVPAIDIPKTGGGTARFVDTSADTVTAGSMMSGVTAHDASGAVVTGTMPMSDIDGVVVGVQADGAVIAHCDHSAGYVEDGSEFGSYQLMTQPATTITPSDDVQYAVLPYHFTTGEIKVAAVPTETITVTENGTVAPTSGKYFSSVTVAVPSYVLDVTFASDRTSPGVIATITDAGLLAHMNDESLTCTVVYMGDYDFSTGIYYLIVGNRSIVEASRYGIYQYVRTDGAASYMASNNPITRDESPSYGFPAIRQNGDLYLRCSSNYVYRAGTYRFIFNW